MKLATLPYLVSWRVPRQQKSDNYDLVFARECCIQAVKEAEYGRVLRLCCDSAGGAGTRDPTRRG